MADVLVLHQGTLPSDEMQGQIEKYGSEAIVGTARFAPERTVSEGSDPDYVVTDDPEMAEFWDGRGVDTELVGEADTSSAFEVVQRSPGWYDVEGPNGEPYNESALREDDALKLAQELNHA